VNCPTSTFEHLNKLGMHIMALEPISAAYFINLSYHPMCLYIYPSVTAKQWFTENITVVTNTPTHAITDCWTCNFLCCPSSQKSGQLIIDLHMITWTNKPNC
jgi:hypothetical protein